MSEELTRRERQISEVVFRLGEASATEIMQALPDQPANATVRTILTILEEKGVVVRRRDGKRYLYRPAHSKKSLAKSRSVKSSTRSSAARWKKPWRRTWPIPKPSSTKNK